MYATIRETRSTPKRSRGTSLLEVIVGSLLLAVALVPALRLIRDSLALGREIETRELLTTFSTSKLEEHLALAGATWSTGNVSGSFASEGYPTLRFLVTRSDISGNGGIFDQLMAVTSTAWEDVDGDGNPDTQEPSVTLAAKVAKTVSYQGEVGSG